jgi:DNA-binding Xre family transcriptional regulator
MELEVKIDEIMEAKGITLDQLVERTGLPRMTIYNARKGLNVTLKNAMRIADALESKLEDVWGIASSELKDDESADISS